MIEVDLIEEAKAKLNALVPLEGLQWISERFGQTARFSTSLGLEDQVITYWIASHKLDIGIFTLDTGRLFQETYDILDLTRKKYNQPIKAYFPNAERTEALLNAKGPNSFFDSVENRKECCHIRKVEPLKAALQNTSIWITGVRADQSGNRNAMQVVEWDENFGVLKYNPLLKWSLDEVDAFIRTNNIPVNVLHKKGFPSIGCAPCTRAIMPGEDPRAGRWWWESSAKECGLHATK